MTTTALTLAARVRPASDVLFRDLEGEAVLVGLTSSCYFGLDLVGTRVWTLMVAHESLAPVLDAIVEEFEVERDVAANDLLRLVGELRDHGLVVVEPT
jgi:hypothetical protein